MTDEKRDELIERLKRGVIDYNEDAVMKAASEVLANEVDVTDAIVNGLASGIEVVGDLFDKNEYFAPELLMSVDALSAGLSVLQPQVDKGAAVAQAHGADQDIVRMLFEIADEWGARGRAQNTTDDLAEAIRRVSSLRQLEAEG